MFTIWSMPGCIWCVRAAELLADRNLPFEKHEPPLVELKVLMRAKGFTALPQVFEDDHHIGGYEALKGYLDALGS